MKNQIKETLKKKLNASFVDVLDESDRHAGHQEARISGGGHYSVTVVSNVFEGKNLLERHKMIYDALGFGKSPDIHALAIKAYTTTEWNLKK